MDVIHLRPARAEDFEFFLRLHERTLGPYVDQVWGWVDDDQRAYLQRTLDVDATQVIVVDGLDIGRLDLTLRDDDVYIGLIEIAVEHQRRGPTLGFQRYSNLGSLFSTPLHRGCCES